MIVGSTSPATPKGALSEGMLDATYEVTATLPSGATDTELPIEYGALWVVPDDNDAVYLVQADGCVHQWPATSAGCD